MLTAAYKARELSGLQYAAEVARWSARRRVGGLVRIGRSANSPFHRGVGHSAAVSCVLTGLASRRIDAWQAWLREGSSSILVSPEHHSDPLVRAFYGICYVLTCLISGALVGFLRLGIAPGSGLWQRTIAPVDLIGRENDMAITQQELADDYATRAKPRPEARGCRPTSRCVPRYCGSNRTREQNGLCLNCRSLLTCTPRYSGLRRSRVRRRRLGSCTLSLGDGVRRRRSEAGLARLHGAGPGLSNLEDLLRITRSLTTVASYPFPVPRSKWEAIQIGAQVAMEERRGWVWGSAPIGDPVALLEGQGVRTGLVKMRPMFPA